MSLASAREQALEIAERINSLGPVSVSRFFSGAGLRAGGVQFGFVIGGSLYLRVDDTNRPAFVAAGATPFSYPGRTGTVRVASYYEAPADVLDDPETLEHWCAGAWRAASVAPPRRARRTPAHL